MYVDDSPILESVFEDLAPNACGIDDIMTDGLPAGDAGWYFQPLTYRELAEWASEVSAA